MHANKIWIDVNKRGIKKKKMRSSNSINEGIVIKMKRRVIKMSNVNYYKKIRNLLNKTFIS